MGNGSYSTLSRTLRSTTMGYTTKSSAEIFTQRNINNAMSPYGISVRECRDSAEHPNTIPIIIALDETGSMGSIPHYFVKEGLPTMMSTLIQRGLADAQVLFLGIGDHECDEAPLQVGQFESSDELLDKWLTSVYLEGKGGGNEGESYLLAWYFASMHTSIDSFEKRGKKGYLFTIGDEPTLHGIHDRDIQTIMGTQQTSSYTAVQLIEQAMKTYNVYHFHVKETMSGGRPSVQDGWKQLLQDNCIMISDHKNIPKLIAEIVTRDEMKTSNSTITKEEEAPTQTEVML